MIEKPYYTIRKLGTQTRPSPYYAGTPANPHRLQLQTVEEILAEMEAVNSASNR